MVNPRATWPSPRRPTTRAGGAGGFDEVRSALRAYLSARDRLHALGVLRGDGDPAGNYAEWLAAKLLHLRLAPSQVQQDYDATDRRGRRYQIKARQVTGVTDATSFDFRRPPAGFEFLLCVFLSRDLTPLGIYRVPLLIVSGSVRVNRAGWRFRWTETRLGDRRISQVWPRTGRRGRAPTSGAPSQHRRGRPVRA